MSNDTYDDNMQQFTFDSFLRLPVDMRKTCVDAVRSLFQEDSIVVASIVTLIENDPCNWVSPYHHGWGTTMRNHLRGYFPDDELPSTDYGDDRGEYKNWDDYYTGIIEVAFKEGIYHLLNDDDKI